MATEKRLILLDHALQAVSENYRSDMPKHELNVLIATRKRLKAMPTVDATLTVHAHWDEWWPGDCSLIMTGEEMLYQCSACTAKFSDVDGFRYCPHCGALMEGINHVESDDQA